MSNASVNDQGDGKQTAHAVLSRDRRRVRSLAALTICLWAAGFFLIASVYLPLGAKLKQYAKLMDAAHPGAVSRLMNDHAVETPPPPPTPEQVPQQVAQVRHENWIVSQIVFHEWFVGAIILGFALGTGFLASIATVALSLTIRRTTLRQINDALAGISEQLRSLQAGR
jgi:DNA-binding IclR family transcriptional regulator